MGIKQLSKLIKEKCAKAIICRKFGYYDSSKIAIDASLSIYQFLIAVRSDGSVLGFGDTTTSHLIGMFYRTIRIVESGITPVYVFDGKAPAMKTEELKKRLEKRQKAEKLHEIAKELEDKKEMEKQDKRTTKVTETHVAECQKLLKLMGIPFVTAVSESEAFCSFLCKKGYVDGVATEDMDALCFGTPILLRNMNAAKSKKLDIDEYNLKMVLKELDLSMDQFIDLCILMGCDYCDTIKGIGYKRAFDLIKKYGSIDEILKNETLEMPENFDYCNARRIFNELSEMGDPGNFFIDYDSIDQAGLVDYLCKEKGFDETRVLKGVEKVMKTQKRGNQTKISDFFTKKK